MERKLYKLMIAFFVILGIVGVVNYFVLSKKQKVFTIGKVYKRSSPGKNGSTYFFKYYINNVEYEGRTDGLNKFMTNSNGLIYVDVLEKDHSRYHVLEFNKVPFCLQIADVPVNGWTHLPNDTICKN